MRTIHLVVAIFASLLFPAVAGATLVVDQEQTIDATFPPFVIGGARGEVLGQTVTAGMSGQLAQVGLAVGCESGTLIVEIVDLEPGYDVPGTRVRTRASIPASALPMEPDFRSITLDRPTHLTSGDRFAIVMRNETGTCQSLRGGAGFMYTGGSGFLHQAVDSPPTWQQLADFPGGTGSYAFRTLMDVPTTGHARPCLVTGLANPLPFPDFVPVCRCLQDEGFRELRCGLLDPSLFLFRRIPSPLQPGEAFTVKWTLMPLVAFKGSVEVSDQLPPGFQGPKTPLVFSGGQIGPGQSITLEYKAVAGQKSGVFKLDTNLSVPGDGQKPDEGKMHTIIEVRSPK